MFCGVYIELISFNIIYLCSHCLVAHRKDRYQPAPLAVRLEYHQVRQAQQERQIKRNCVALNRQRDGWAVCQVVGIRFDDHKV